MDWNKYIDKQMKMIKVGGLMVNKNNGSLRIITEITQESYETIIHHYDFDFNRYGRWPLSYYKEQLKMGKYEFYV